MDEKTIWIGLLLALSGATSAIADDNEVAEGLQLYNKECAMCHGVMTHPAASGPAPVRVAMAPMTGAGAADFRIPLPADWRDVTAGPDLQQGHAASPDHIAVVPLYGPPLKGIIGRVAGTFSGYTYSQAFLKKMDGVTWDEARLDTWIKSSQTMVPGSFMFFSEKKPELRSRIVQYVKTQTQ